MRTEYAHDISVDYPMSEAIQLFTPRGEESWVPGWEPRYVHPTHGETREEMLFTTGHGGETTFWTCMKWEPDAGHARYFRLTPGSRVAFVDVQCHATSARRTAVRVTYETHALSDAGRAEMAEMTQQTFNEMIDGWAQLIRDMPGNTRDQRRRDASPYRSESSQRIPSQPARPNNSWGSRTPRSV